MNAGVEILKETYRTNHSSDIEDPHRLELLKYRRQIKHLEQVITQKKSPRWFQPALSPKAQPVLKQDSLAYSPHKSQAKDTASLEKDRTLEVRRSHDGKDSIERRSFMSNPNQSQDLHHIIGASNPFQQTGFSYHSNNRISPKLKQSRSILKIQTEKIIDADDILKPKQRDTGGDIRIVASCSKDQFA